MRNIESTEPRHHHLLLFYMSASLRLFSRRTVMVGYACAIGIALAGSSVGAAAPPLPKDVKRVLVVFSEGHDTDEVDRGRPVVLIAAALGVKTEVFREAFSGVRPAGHGSGGPTEAEARKNKDALLKVLGPKGVTNSRLDEVSNFYRYRPGQGNLWKNTPAVANALVKNGEVIGYEIISGGAGYTTPPKVSVPGVENVPTPKVEISFGKDLDTNGSVSAMVIPKGKGNGR